VRLSWMVETPDPSIVLHTTLAMRSPITIHLSMVEMHIRIPAKLYVLPFWMAVMRWLHTAMSMMAMKALE